MISSKLTLHKIDGLILETVKEVLTEIFGELPVMYMLLTMKETHNLEVNDIPQEPQVFSRALQDILGKNSVLIEELIMEILHMKLEEKSKAEDNYEFSEHIRDLRNQHR